LEDSLVVIEAEIATLLQKSERLKSHMTPGKGFFTEDEAVRRYQEMVYLYLIGDYDQSAEGFFALVTTMALGNTGLHWDAEWYLAESLFQMRNGRSAEQQYQQIFENDSHPFRDDAIRRLLEIYVANGNLDAFMRLYEGEIVSGRVKTSDRITYTVGKAFFSNEDYLHAKTELDAITSESPYYLRALYIRGAIAVAESDLEYAETTFKVLVDNPVGNSIDRKVWDLGQLALGRIAMELGQFELATNYYEKIAGDSEFLADKLYELVWALIKQKQDLRTSRLGDDNAMPEEESAKIEVREQELVHEALRRVEIFLLAYPEHSYTAQLKLLRGHLHLQASEYEDALSSYEEVILAYAPIKQQFGTLSQSENAPGEYFERILRISDDNSDNPDKLPAYALAMVMADRDLGRAITVYRDLGAQREILERSETLIAELELVFGDSEGIGGFERIRYDVAFQQSLTRQKQLELLAI
jgi:tetratricopeptide (TPR) repeat protein